MVASGSNDQSKQDLQDLASSAVSSAHKARPRQRLSEALRANLGRRKAQQRERGIKAEPAAEGKPPQDEDAGNGTGTKAFSTRKD
jgi:hypothetical protein